MINLIFIIPITLGILLIGLAIKIGIDRIPAKTKQIDTPKPSPIPAPLLDFSCEIVSTANNDTIFWENCLSAVQNQRACLDEEKLLLLLNLTRALNTPSYAKQKADSTIGVENIIQYNSQLNQTMSLKEIAV